MDSFIAEAKAKKLKTLEELNHYWAVYLDGYYHKEPHVGIREYYESLNVEVPDKGITPEQEWNRDTRPLKYLDAAVVGEAFRHHEKRKVDKGACISFRGRRYETKASLIGFTVEISYDPASPEILTVNHPGTEPFQAVPLKIGEYCSQKPELPVSMQPAEPETSRFLDALEKKLAGSAKCRADAISFGSYRKEIAFVLCMRFLSCCFCSPSRKREHSGSSGSMLSGSSGFLSQKSPILRGFTGNGAMPG